jgi:hypothetical protein
MKRNTCRGNSGIGVTNSALLFVGVTTIVVEVAAGTVALGIIVAAGTVALGIIEADVVV